MRRALLTSPSLLLSTSLLLLLLTSLLAAIPVLQAASSSPSSPGVSIVRAPESTVAPLGDEVVLLCETSLPPERFEWSFLAGSSFSSSASSSGSRRLKYLKTKTHYNISITHDNDISRLRLQVRPETLGEYRCIAWFGPLAVTSTAARLQLASIGNATAQPAALWQWLPAGNTLLWQCGQVTSNPPPSWSFYHNERQLQQAAGANGTLLLANISATDSGSYSCVATNTASGVRVTLPGHMELQVTSRDALPLTAPHLLAGQQQPSKLTARAGDTLILPCAGVGNPPPKAVWSRPDTPSALHNNRTQIRPLGLQIQQLQAQDSGSYICYLDNGQRPALEHRLQLEVQQAPSIVLPPNANLTNEGERLQLQCLASGMPQPTIYWLLNGESSSNDVEAELQPNGTLLLHSVQKRHAGYVQCFARNTLGEHSAGTLLQVNPKQIQSASEQQPVNRHGHGRKPKLQMVPPSAPNVTRLTDESVMLRWQVQRNEGLPILFFKVQYRMLAEHSKRKSWHTTNDNIPYGKERQSGKNFTSSVVGLKPDRSYRFRIMAVYSNNDNKESNTSGKFFLQRGAALAPLPVPDLLEIVEHSQTAVVLHWRLDSSADEQLVSGYYAYYRPSASAGEYLKATIDGATSRSFQIGALEPGTIYEFKLQSFSAVAASEFSALKQGRTQRPRTTTTAQPMLHHGLDTTTPSHNDTFHMNPLLTGTIGGGALLLLLLLSLCLCLCRRRNSRSGSNQQQHKPRLAELREDFVPLSACSPSKPRNRHIHITLNPLAQQQQQQLQPSLEEKDAPELSQDMGYLGYNGLGRMSSNSLRRSQRTLERAAAGGASGGNNNHLNQPQDTLTDSPRLQSSSNKPGRVILKRTRLSSRSENLSSGSLNSVGV
ncbi:hypothetical protein KR044_013374 [Drosophila immigrans]|nr:hypothetical protein KR044_013374 [Drosophila immigrans]